MLDRIAETVHGFITEFTLRKALALLFLLLLLATGAVIYESMTSHARLRKLDQIMEITERLVVLRGEATFDNENQTGQIVEQIEASLLELATGVKEQARSKSGLQAPGSAWPSTHWFQVLMGSAGWLWLVPLSFNAKVEKHQTFVQWFIAGIMATIALGIGWTIEFVMPQTAGWLTNLFVSVGSLLLVAFFAIAATTGTTRRASAAKRETSKNS